MDKLSKIRVLYVEDDEFIREELAETLEFDVKELIVAKNGLEGLEKFKQFNPDLVITDVKMPKMDGLMMSKEIKNISPKTPIIVTTAFSDSDYLMKAIEIGIDRYVTKPVDIDKLYDAINEIATILLYEKEKEVQNKYLRYILDFNPSFILIANDKDIEYINKTFLNFLGFNSFEDFKENVEEVDNLVEFVEDLNGNRYNNSWIKEILNNKNTQHIIHFKNNSQKPFIVLQNSFKDLNKHILLFSDVTNLELNRLALNEEISKLKEENTQKLELLKLQAKQALMGEMIAAIAHQLKQPLNILNMNLQLVDIDDIEEESLEFCMENSLKQIEYMVETIDDFKMFLSPNKQMKKFKFSDVMQDILRLVSKQLELHNIKIDIKGDAIIYGYKIEFEQVLMNLIKNAKDAFDEIDINNKYIKIEVIENENVSIFVEDNAGGMPKEILSKIFNSYFTTKKTGTGIGLYISKMLIEDMKGGIFVDSKEGKTIFNLRVLKG